MKNEKIGQALKKYRKKNAMSVPDVALKLRTEYNRKVAEKTIYGWESNQAHPTTDMFLTLAAWHRPDEICRLATVVLMRREQNRYLDDAVRRAWDDLEERFHAQIVQINLPPILLSSSDVRERIAAGKDVSDALPNGVIRYIRENRLYGWNE